MRAKRSAKGRERSTCSWARLTLAAATRRMASVILRVFLTELIRSRIALRFAMVQMPQAVARRVDLTSLMAAFNNASDASFICLSV